MIIPKIVFPLPFDDWFEFEPFTRRFTDTFKQFPPGIDYELFAMCCWGEPTDKVREMFYGIKTTFLPYYENGADIGSAQRLAAQLSNDTFMVMMTSRCYFHRAGWLAVMVNARNEHGPGLYGCSANHDGHRLHLCTRAYAMDAADFKAYPTVIDSRALGPYFEIGQDNPNGNLMEWMEKRGRKSRLVFFDGAAHEKSEWFSIENRFRHGDQSAMLVWDKHTDIWANASEPEKQRMTLCNLPPV